MTAILCDEGVGCDREMRVFAAKMNLKNRTSGMQQHMVLLIMFCIGLICLYPTGVNSASSEAGYERKLQSILLFARLSEWPPETFAAPNDPFILGVLG